MVVAVEKRIFLALLSPSYEIFVVTLRMADNRLFDKHCAKIIGVARHRISTDGDGVTTLVAFHGCPLRCWYCLNPSLGDGSRFKEYSPQSLYDEVRIDELYFLATNGGVTFGGGEPCLHPDFIREFHGLCDPTWQINLETSLNVPSENIKSLLPIVDTLIIDVKDINPAVYCDYTGRDNVRVVDNLKLIADQARQMDCVVRLPLIPGYNNDADRISSRAVIEALGFTRFDLFTYQIRKH